MKQVTYDALGNLAMLNPKDGSVDLDRAKIYIAMGDIEQALGALKKSIENKLITTPPHNLNWAKSCINAMKDGLPLSFRTLSLSAPARLRRGQDGQLGLSFSGKSPAAMHVFHIDVLDPAGKVVAYYSGNVLAPNGRADRILPLALNDRTGTWSIRVRDLLTGQTQSAFVEVF